MFINKTVIFIVFVFFVLQIQEVVLFAKEQERDDVILLVDIKGLTKGNYILGYTSPIKSEVVYLPLIDFLSNLDFPILINSPTLIETWFVDSLNKVSFNLQNKTIKFKNKAVVFKATDLQIDSEGNVFVTNELLEQLFQLKIAINIQQSIVRVDSENTLPIETTYNKDKSRKRNVSRDVLSNTDVIVENYNTQFTTHSLDLYTTYRSDITTKDHNNKRNEAYSANLHFGGILFGMDSSLQYTTQQYGNSSSNRFFANLSKYYFDDNLFNTGFLSLGDTYTPSNTLLSSGKSSRGVYVSSFNSYINSDDRTVTLEGSLLPGWEVELYKNGVLLSYVTSPVNGRYKFENMSSVNGINVFTLIFYGPFGEVKKEEKRILVGSNPVKENEIGYNINVGQNNRKFIENSNEYSYYDNYNNMFNAEATMYYGILDNLTFTPAYSLQNQPDDLKTQNQFVKAGFLHSVASINSELSVAMRNNHNKAAFSASTNTNIKNGNLFVSYNKYNGIKSDKSYTNSQYINDVYEVRLSNSIPLHSIVLPLIISYKSTLFEKTQITNNNNIFVNQEKREEEIYSRVFYSVFSNYFITIEDKHRTIRVKEGKERGTNTFNTLFILGSTSFNNISLRGKLDYDLLPKTVLSKIGATLERRSKEDKSYAYIEVVKNYRSLTKNASIMYKVGGSKTTNFGKIGAYLSTNLNKQYEVGFSYGISFGYAPLSKKIYVETDKLLNQSANVEARVFFDKNGNKIYDKETDELLPEAKIKINYRPTQETTDKNGRLIVTGISKYTDTSFELDNDSLDINYVALTGVSAYKLRPAVTLGLDFPVEKAGDLEGVVYTNYLRITKPYKTALIKIYNVHNTNYIPVLVDTSGSFVLEKLAYGTYYATGEIYNTKTKNLVTLRSKVFEINSFSNSYRITLE